MCFACEGGVTGVWHGDYIELRNWDDFDDRGDTLGLMVSDSDPSSPGMRQVMGWYHRLLRILFCERLHPNASPGDLLTLEERNPQSKHDALVLLYLALKRKMMSGKRARAVFDQLREERWGIGGMYLAGLTDEDIKRIYVPSFEDLGTR